MAFTIDFGYIQVAETQMQRCVDAATMAACWEMYDQKAASHDAVISESATLAAANASAAMNTVGNDVMQIAATDMQLGRYGLNGAWDTTDPTTFNAVRVTLRRQSSSNGELPLFFGEVTGRDTQALQISSTAAMFSAISGFYEPGSSEEFVDILPIAFDSETWDLMCSEATTDDYTVCDGVVTNGADGYFEGSLYPDPDMTGAPGNRGTIDIGGANNSTVDLARQVVSGISKQDFIDLGKPLTFDENGELLLNGDTGISAGIKDELASLIGKKRIVPIFSQVTGEGNNAVYTIIRWEGISIIDVNLTGSKSSKRVTIQPARVVARHARIDYSGTYSSSFAVTPVMLVQ